MLHILFVPGTFGTTVQYVVRQYNKKLLEYRIKDHYKNLIFSDGSMHGFFKTGHYLEIKDLNDYLDNKIDQDIPITSPIYPTSDAHADTIINLFCKHRPLDNYVFIYIDNIVQAEITMLAHYYKISIGSVNKSIGSMCGDNQHNIINWNPNYTHWSQMQIWELREWISLFYEEWVQEWIDAKSHVPPNWFTVSSGDILENTRETFLKIINYVGEFDHDLENEFTEFIKVWKEKQQYLLDEHNLIKNIVESTVSKTLYTWPKLNLISTAIVQKRLRDQGYEIKCYNLNDFPTNSSDLYNLLEHT